MMIDASDIFKAAAVKVVTTELELPENPCVIAAQLKSMDHFSFLDSGKSGDDYSILAWEPKLVFRSKGDAVKIRWRDQWSETKGNPFDILKPLLAGRKITHADSDDIPFYGGAVGYFGYDLFEHVEKYTNLQADDDLDLPDCCLAFYDSALIFHHRQNKWILTAAPVFNDTDNAEKIITRKIRQLNSLTPDAPIPEPIPSPEDDGDSEIRSNFTRDQYLRAVEAALEYIRAGDIYQVNLSQRFQKQITATAFDVFKVLRNVNPSKYGAFLQYDTHAVISSSPELFLRTEGRQVMTRPIKGTRPRGSTPENDARFCDDLQNSPKDRAELSMIVDLERNDLGRVCVYGSVKVARHAYVEKLPTVFHTVSEVRGTMRDDVEPLDLIKAAFPCGSITGCPKIRSIEIIDELEPTRRNVYTGSIGYIDFSGDMTLNVAIRTMIAKGSHIYFQVGGGIVADSDPQAEYDETLDKAAAMIRTLHTV